jgi:hypothetical protein
MRELSTSVPERGASLQAYEVACRALKSGKCLEIQYEAFRRIIEVHRVGISAKGEYILSGWQILGPAPERVGWKLVNLDEPLLVRVTDIPSQAPRPDYRRGIKRFTECFCQL